MKKLGVVGGLGPETAFKFCLNINDKIKAVTGRQPDIIVENLPVSAEAEQRIINGKESKEHFELVINAVKMLNNVGVDLIAIPCNTVHAFLQKLRQESIKPVLSIMEECARECKLKNIKILGLLASETTVKEQLFERELEAVGIRIITADKKQQQAVNTAIINIINRKTVSDDFRNLLKITSQMKEHGAECILLGCTDLHSLLSQKDIVLPVIDSCSVLENAVIKKMLEGVKNE